MSNLIITIISIALVAITALLGLVFLSPAIDNYTISVKANTLTASLQQIQQGANLYITDAAVNYFATPGAGSLSQGGIQVLQPKYLSSYPSLLDAQFDPTNSFTFSLSGYSYTAFAYCHNNTSGQLYLSIDKQKVNTTLLFINKDTGCVDAFTATNETFDATDDIVKVCKKINQNAALPSGVSLDATTGLPLSAFSVGGSGVSMLSNYGRPNSTKAIPLRNACFITPDLQSIGISYTS